MVAVPGALPVLAGAGLVGTAREIHLSLAVCVDVVFELHLHLVQASAGRIEIESSCVCHLRFSVPGTPYAIAIFRREVSRSRPPYGTSSRPRSSRSSSS